MTNFVSVRALDTGGPVRDPEFLSSDGGPSPTYRKLDPAQVETNVAGKDVILAIHGFNVSRPNAIRSFITLEHHLQLGDHQAFFGVLWPGDFIVPVINYPAEAKDAVASGQKVAAGLSRWFKPASSISLISHSLGGRVLLEAAACLDRPVAEACITAGAVDDDCLSSQYAKAKANSGRISVLASKSDKVLLLAYPLGDFASDLFWRDNDTPWRAALGRAGPRPTEPGPKVRHSQIPKGMKYGHGDYFPPGDGDASPAKWNRSADYMRASINGRPDGFKS